MHKNKNVRSLILYIYLLSIYPEVFLSMLEHTYLYTFAHKKS